MLAPDRPPHPRHTAFVEGQLLREAEASVALDKGDGQTQSFEGAFTAVAPEPPEPADDQGQEELEEVTVEPDLPTDQPAPSPSGPTQVAPARSQYEQMVAAMPADEPVYVAGNRAPRLKVGDYVLQPGDVVPGAHGWKSRESYERLGRIERR